MTVDYYLFKRTVQNDGVKDTIDECNQNSPSAKLKKKKTTYIYGSWEKQELSLNESGR